MKNLALLLVFSFIGCLTTIQRNDMQICKNLSKEVRLKIDTLKNGIMEGDAIGIGGYDSEQYQRFWFLWNNTKEPDLIKLTDHSSPTVRCYAFQGLVWRKSSNVREILEKHLRDTSEVMYMSGCVGDFYTSFDYMLRLASERKHNLYSYDVLIDSMETEKLRNRHLEIIGNSPRRSTVESHLNLKNMENDSL
jgi:hypothetical protein